MVLSAFFAVGLVVGGVVAPANAEAASLDVAAVCGAAQGTWDVTWTVTNPDADDSETIIASSNPTLVPLQTVIAGAAVFTAQETVSSADARALEITGQWSHGSDDPVEKVLSATLEGSAFPDCAASGPTAKATVDLSDQAIVPLVDVTATMPVAVAQTCANDERLVDGYVLTNGNDDVTYTIVGKAPRTYINIPFAPKKSVVPTGDYVVTATATAGHQLKGDHGPWLLTVDPYGESCQQLPSHADWAANATATSQMCGANGITDGYITVDLVQEPGFQDRVQYFVRSTELTATQTEMAPGTYTVTAKARYAGDTVDTSSWIVAVGAAGGACSQLSTLAFTGPSSNQFGMTLIALSLLVAGTVLFVFSQKKSKRTGNARG